jgi:MerR family transcriptional regulator, light-induced transcriptional regulator
MAQEDRFVKYLYRTYTKHYIDKYWTWPYSRLVTDQGARYPIGAVSRLTGVAIDTLRIWERRYGVVTPARDERGRMYSDADVRRLQLLAAAVARGHAIGRVAKLPDAELEALLAVQPARVGPEFGTGNGRAPIAALMSALAAYDAEGLDRELGRLAVALPPKNLVHRVVLPVMKEVGDEWEAGRISAGQEHLLSAALRNLLGALLRLSVSSRGARRLVFATPSGDRHEFGILAAAMLAALGGLGVVYLGPDLPAAQIHDAATLTESDVVVLGVTYGGSQPPSMAEVQALAERLPPSVELWLGGPLPAGVDRSITRPGLVLLKDFPALETHLARIGSRL